MLIFKRSGIALFFSFFLTFSVAKAGMTISAGSNQTGCIGDSVTIGGNPTATGGTAPYIFSWSPSANMNNPADSNPHVKITGTTWYYLTVTDASGNRKIDSVLVSVDQIYKANAGRDTSICPPPSGSFANLGGPNNLHAYTYSWTPTTGLSCPTCWNPTATPTVTTTYRLIASDAECSDTTYVTVTILPKPTLTTVSPVTINEGQTVKLSASGAVQYIWTPNTNIFNANTSSPEVYPNSTTTYTVIGTGSNGCIDTASVVVDVIPDSNLIFYNTFTPNHDGFNDFWYIGNIGLFPNNDVYIYNRYGKQVYYTHAYYNTWDGTNLGSDLPDGTYYYIVYTGTGKEYNGSVTIIRKP